LLIALRTSADEVAIELDLLPNGFSVSSAMAFARAFHLEKIQV
jgi:hypothetical protein